MEYCFMKIRHTLYSCVLVALTMCLSLGVQANFSESYDAHQTSDVATPADVQAVDSVTVESEDKVLLAPGIIKPRCCTLDDNEDTDDVAQRDIDKHVGRVINRQGSTSTTG